MGLQNASQQFQHLMEDRLHPVRDIADPYIDDIILGKCVDSGEDLLAANDREVRRALQLLKGDQFIVGKWKLFAKEVEFCGHILGGEVRRPAPGKLRAIEKWELP